jgi:hypothetical protein
MNRIVNNIILFNYILALLKIYFCQLQKYITFLKIIAMKNDKNIVIVLINLAKIESK